LDFELELLEWVVLLLVPSVQDCEGQASIDFEAFPKPFFAAKREEELI
jgi:hypothetical protein